MALDPYVPYLDPVSNGDIINEDDWNGQWDTLADYLNSIAIPAINDLQDQPSVATFAQSRFDARMSLTTGVPITPGNVSSTNVYLVPYGGNLIGIYNEDDEVWENIPLSGTLTIAVPSSVNELHYLWVYHSSGIPILEWTDFKSLVASSSPAAGRDVSITMADTDGILVDDIVTISDGSNSEEALVTLVNSDVSITVDFLVNSYTTPTIKTNESEVAIVYQDGVPVQEDALNKRLVGMVFTSSLGTVTDSLKMRGLSNYYNRVPRPIGMVSETGDWSFGAGPTNHSVWRVPQDQKGYTNEQIFFIAGPQPVAWSLTMNRKLPNQTTGMAIGFNKLTPYLAPEIGDQNNRRATLTRSGNATRGRNVLRGLFHGGGTNNTVTGEESQPNDSSVSGGDYYTGTYSGMLAAQ